MQKLVTASQQGDYIKSVNPVTEDGKSGYEIEFAKNGTITIFNGKDGQNGADGKDGQDGKDGKDGVDVGTTPDIGIRKDTDDVYYWTLNGEWLLDDAGNKIKAVATDGAPGSAGAQGPQGEQGAAGEQGPKGEDGVTPVLKIEDGYWYVSYDGGKTFQTESLGKATGENGKDGAAGGDSIFKEVKDNGSYVNFILSDGTVFTLQKSAASALNITFDVEQGVAIVPGTTIKVAYTVTNGDANTVVRTTRPEWELYSVVKPTDAATGYIYIWLSEDYDEDYMDDELDDEMFPGLTEGDLYESSLMVLVSVSDGKGNNVLKALNIVPGKMISVSDAYLADSVAGTVTATLKTNVTEGTYDVHIPTKAQSWLSYVPQTKSMRNDVLNFRLTANEDEKFRSATVAVKNELAQTLETFVIVQRSEIAGNPVVFKDEKVKNICTARFDENADNILTYEEIATVTDIKDLFLLDKSITSFDELEYFTSLTTIPEGLFANCENLVSVKIPESVVYIEDEAFAGCVSLESVELPEGVTGKRCAEGGSYEMNAASWFKGCTDLKTVVLPSTLEVLPSHCFEGCASLTEITVPERITGISRSCFKYCVSLTDVNVSKPMTFVSTEAFYGCTSLKEFDFSGLVEYNREEETNGLGGRAFAMSGLETVIIPETITEINGAAFAGCTELSSVTLHDGITSIRENAFGIIHDDYYDRSYACASLKNVELPQNLLRIGYSAFVGSAIEGTPVDGTQLKALEIPAKVTFIGYDAFAECANLSAVKMYSSYPPEGSHNMFNEVMTVYVSSESVKAYQSAEYWNSYAILPFEMMSVSIGLDFEVLDGEKFRDGRLTFPVRLSVNGDESSMDNVEEYGFYVKTGEYDEVSYQPVAGMNVKTDTTMCVNLDRYDIKETDGYVFEMTAQVGAYVRLADGTIVRYDNRTVGLVYDETPSISFVSVNQDGQLVIDVKGAMWLYEASDLETETVGDGELHIAKEMELSDGEVRCKYDAWLYGQEMYGNAVIRDYYHDKEYRTDNYLHFVKTSDEYYIVEVVDELGSVGDEAQYSMTLDFLDLTGAQYYSRGEFCHGVRFALSGDKELVEKASEYGIWVMPKKNEDDVKYFSISNDYGMGEEVSGYIGINSGWYDIDASNFYAGGDFVFGAYAVMPDGNTYRYDAASGYRLEYNEKPEITFRDAVSVYLGEQEHEYYDYTYDENGSVVDSTFVKANLHTYTDSLFYEAKGSCWMGTPLYYVQAEKMSQSETDGPKNLYYGYGQTDADGSWIMPLNNLAGGNFSTWNYEYFLYYASDNSWHVTTNYLSRKWNADNTCSYEIIDSMPDDPYLYDIAQTKSMINRVKKPVTRNEKRNTVAKIINPAVNLPLFKESTIAR